MKVIKEGKIKATMQVTCKTCEAELEIEAGDVKKCLDDQFAPTPYFYRCPCCGSKEYLGDEDLTEEIFYGLK